MASLQVPTGAKKFRAGITWRKSTGVGSSPSSISGTSLLDSRPSAAMLCSSICKNKEPLVLHPPS